MLYTGITWTLQTLHMNPTLRSRLLSALVDSFTSRSSCQDFFVNQQRVNKEALKHFPVVPFVLLNVSMKLEYSRPCSVPRRTSGTHVHPSGPRTDGADTHSARDILFKVKKLAYISNKFFFYYSQLGRQPYKCDLDAEMLGFSEQVFGIDMILLESKLSLKMSRISRSMNNSEKYEK